MTFEQGEGRAVWTLALTQALGYACFFYIFAALLIYWQRETALSDGVIAAGPLLATVVSALVAPGVGRAVDRGRAVVMMAAGPVIGAAALVLLALAQGEMVWFAAWAGLGLAQALCLYDVCFGMMIRRFGPEARGRSRGSRWWRGWPRLWLFRQGLGWPRVGAGGGRSGLRWRWCWG